MSLPKPIPYEEAQARLLGLAKTQASETLPLSDALGRYLARDIHAQRTQPPADLSAMDGYAVPADKLDGPWEIVGESAAGHPFTKALSQGQAVRISTGAVMPAGSGAILLQENARRDGLSLTVAGKDCATPRHIRARGLDFHEGDVLLPAGRRVEAPQIALALSGGHTQAHVGLKPSIAILDNGDELAADPRAVGDHQIPASNGAMLAAMASPYANNIQRLGPIPDDRDALLAALKEADSADIIVTSGGASVGDHDLIRPVLSQWGAKLDFWRIAMKPGKPLLVAKRGEQIILGLPGNPVSSFVTAWLFLLPLMRKLGGAAEPLPKPILLPCNQELAANGPRATFIRARLCEEGVTPIVQQDSSALAALAASNALIARPISAPESTAGALVPVFPLGFPAGD